MVFNKKTNWNKTLFSLFVIIKQFSLYKENIYRVNSVICIRSDPLSCGIGRRLLDLSLNYFTSGTSKAVSLQTLGTFTGRK